MDERYPPLEQLGPDEFSFKMQVKLALGHSFEFSYPNVVIFFVFPLILDASIGIGLLMMFG